MSALSGVVAVVLTGAALGVLLWIRGLLADRVSLGQRERALELSDERVRAMETAAEADRRRRAKELDAKIAEVRTAADAERLLREQLARTKPN